MRVASWLAAQAGIFPQFLFAMAAHEGKFQRPPRQAHHRHPNQLLFKEEFEQRDAAGQQMLQHQDVDPRLMIAVDQIPATRSQPGNPLHIPARGLGQSHPAAVAANPGFGDAHQERIEPQSSGAKRQQALHHRQQQQKRHPEQGVQHKQQRSEQTDQRSG